MSKGGRLLHLRLAFVLIANCGRALLTAPAREGGAAPARLSRWTLGRGACAASCCADLYCVAHCGMALCRPCHDGRDMAAHELLQVGAVAVEAEGDGQLVCSARAAVTSVARLPASQSLWSTGARTWRAAWLRTSQTAALELGTLTVASPACFSLFCHRNCWHCLLAPALTGSLQQRSCWWASE